MNKKIILSVFCIVTLLGLFAVATPTSAMTCDSATLTGTVITGTPPTHARFEYSTNYNTVAGGGGITTPVQYFYTEGTFPIQQFISGLSENTTYYFRLVVTNNYGTQALNINNFTTPACPVTPTPTNPPTVNLQINGSHSPAPINSGGTATAIWAAQPSNSSSLSCTGSGGTGIWPGGKPLSGVAIFNLTQSTTFTITCTDSFSLLSATDSVFVNVIANVVNTRPVITLNGSSNVSINMNQTYNDAGATAFDQEDGNISFNIIKTGFVNTSVAGTYTIIYNVSDSIGLAAIPVSRTVNVITVQQPMSGTISPSNPSCIISAGQNSCPVTLTWNTINPVSTSSITKYPNIIVANGNNGTNSFTVTYPSIAFYLYNSSQLLDVSNATANCASGTSWNGNSCQTSTSPNCQDIDAINNGFPLPCRYPNPIPQYCQDPNAINYGRALPCRDRTMPPTVTISADQTSIVYNGGTIIRWSANPTNGVTCNASGGSNGWSGNRGASGSFFTGQLISTTNFYINCSNNGGSTNDSVTVGVGNPPNIINPTCQNPNAINYGGALPCRYANIQPTINLSADNTLLDFDEGTTIRWYSNNATFCNATGGANGWSGNRNTSGTFYTGVLGSSRTFGITCSNSNGNSASDSVTINFYVNNNSDIQPSVNIYADDTNLDFDDNTRIRWDSTNADYCNATGGTNGWSGNRSTSGSFNTGSLTGDETYRIICTNSDSGRTNSDSITIYIDDDNNNDSDRPSVTIFADRTSLSSNESTIIRWYPNDADSCNATGGTNGWSGKKSTSGGSFNTGSLNSTATYSINCTNDSGSDNDSVTVYVNNNNNYSAPVATAPTAVTTNATQLSNTSAQLNSLIFTSGSDTTTWFEWGTTTNLGNSTNQSSIGSVASVTHSAVITGLSTGVTYYFRAAAENSYLRSYGNIMSFTMRNLSAVAGTSTIIRPTTIINRGGVAESLVMLTIDGGSENISPLERRNYQVTWKNISSQTLGKVVLRVIFPKSITFESANKGFFSKDDNTLTLEIGTLSPGETDNMFILASAGNNLTQGELMVTVANLIYTDQSNAQGDALAYTTQRADLSGSVLGASAFGAGFLPSSFLGWLLLLILLLIILLLSRYLYNQFKSPQPPVVIQH